MKVGYGAMNAYSWSDELVCMLFITLGLFEEDEPEWNVRLGLNELILENFGAEEVDFVKQT
jgi:hypothetical protein